MANYVLEQTAAQVQAAINAALTAAQRITFNSVSVTENAFIADATYEDFGYRAAVALSGVTESMTPEVIFDVREAVGGGFAPVANSYNGGVYIYATEPPSGGVTIPKIICWK